MSPPRLRLTVDLDALAANWRWMQACGMGASCGAALKANAYGLGLAPVAARLWREGCQDFFVATIAEAAALRAVLRRANIHVLNGLLPGETKDMAELQAIPVLNDPGQLDLWRDVGTLPCDVMLDTGINRLGIPQKELENCDFSDLAVDVALSHFACADDPEHPLNAQQISLFSRLLAKVPHRRASLANSAGALLTERSSFDLIRPGIALYGGNPVPGRPSPVQAVAKLEAQVIQLKTLTKGESVGYGATWTAQRPTRLATLAIGYADGFWRSLSGKTEVAIGGSRCPLVGRVSMDLVTVDVSDAPRVAVGDWATLLGGDGPSLEMLSQISGMSQYELLTGLGDRYERVYVQAQTL
jgi:alanine racemase